MAVKAVVLLSGGLDSTTVCAIARSEGREIHALTIDYNQRHRKELDAARRVAQSSGVQEHLILSLDLSLFGGSSLTDMNMEVQKGKAWETIGTSIPSSYVPARNTVFLSLALAYAETRAASELWIGVNCVDYSGYPDCRPEFLKSFEETANLGTRAGINGARFSVRAPLLNLSKGEIIRKGLSLGVDYSQTLTCYSPTSEGLACGQCESCLLRLAGFREAGIEDPIPYVNRSRR